MKICCYFYVLRLLNPNHSTRDRLCSDTSPYGECSLNLPNLPCQGRLQPRQTLLTSLTTSWATKRLQGGRKQPSGDPKSDGTRSGWNGKNFVVLFVLVNRTKPNLTQLNHFVLNAYLKSNCNQVRPNEVALGQFWQNAIKANRKFCHSGSALNSQLSYIFMLINIFLSSAVFHYTIWLYSFQSRNWSDCGPSDGLVCD